VRELERLGLKGGCQLHVAPLVQRADQRVHQVFRGFGSDVSAMAAQLRRQYPDETPAWLFRGDAKQPLTLAELAEFDAQPDDVFVVPAMQTDHPGGLYGLVWVVDRLLGPGGCPWDQEQTHETLKKHLIEEAYELLQAIDENSDEGMKEELGDVLLQPIMHAQMKSLANGWDIDTVARGIIGKLVRRHPHVFGDTDAEDSEQVLKNWDRIKQNEKGDEPQSLLQGVPKAMPALLRAHEISKRAARSGFEWPDMDSVWNKLKEEEQELKEAVAKGDPKAVEQEVGDLLFTAVNVARWAGVEPEDALRSMLDRFVRRFQAMERMAEGPLADLSPAEWDNLWERAKAEQAVGES